MKRSTIVRVQEGLHARPATRFVKLAKKFESDIEISKAGKSVSAKSAVKLMLLGVKELDEVSVKADGADAIEAVEALIGYLENPLSGQDDGTHIDQAPLLGADPATPKRSTEQTAGGADLNLPPSPLSGVPASEGIAIGKAFCFFPEDITPPNRLIAKSEIGAEIARLQTAIATVQNRMDQSLQSDSLADTDRSIVAALRDIASDDSLIDAALDELKKGQDAVSAVLKASGEVSKQFGALDDPYLNARADDVLAIGRQICLALMRREDINLSAIEEGAILVTHDIGAWDLARAPLKKIAGIICGHGGATSHVAIIARTHGIPAILGVGDAVEQLKTADKIALNGSNGAIYADPDEDLAAKIQIAVDQAQVEKQSLQAFRSATPRRADGTVIEVAANIGALEEIDAALDAGAMGVGLFRTELLFMRHIQLPSEDLQTETYSALLKAFAPHAVIVRTLDIGGDKPISGIEFPKEENPFLGWRGIRMCLETPSVFKPQLRALLRSAVHGNLKVMLPMISDVEEIRATKALISECIHELKAEGRQYAEFDLGIMVETPAAVLAAAELAKEAAFFSIGTNDLTQYIMAADRLNPSVAKLNDVRHPAVMRAIEMTARAGQEAGIMVGMCGEAAGNPDLLIKFIEMGLTELSMSPASIPRAKKLITQHFKT